MSSCAYCGRSKEDSAEYYCAAHLFMKDWHTCAGCNVTVRNVYMSKRGLDYCERCLQYRDG